MILERRSLPKGRAWEALPPAGFCIRAHAWSPAPPHLYFRPTFLPLKVGGALCLILRKYPITHERNGQKGIRLLAMY